MTANSTRAPPKRCNGQYSTSPGLGQGRGGKITPTLGKATAPTRIAKIDGSLAAYLDLSLAQQSDSVDGFEQEILQRMADMREEVQEYAIQIRFLIQTFGASSQSKATDEGLKCPETRRGIPPARESGGGNTRGGDIPYSLAYRGIHRFPRRGTGRVA